MSNGVITSENAILFSVYLAIMDITVESALKLVSCDGRELGVCLDRCLVGYVPRHLIP